jgi:hypothetical protein
MCGGEIAFENAPDGTLIDFGGKTIDPKTVDTFANLYGPLKASCVILTGSGAASHRSDQQLRNARRLLGGVLANADARFIATRDADVIPWNC